MSYKPGYTRVSEILRPISNSEFFDNLEGKPFNIRHCAHRGRLVHSICSNFIKRPTKMNPWRLDDPKNIDPETEIVRYRPIVDRVKEEISEQLSGNEIAIEEKEYLDIIYNQKIDNYPYFPAETKGEHRQAIYNIIDYTVSFLKMYNTCFHLAEDYYTSETHPGAGLLLTAAFTADRIIEKPLYDDKLKVCGTPDYIGYLSPQHYNIKGLVLLDFKTSLRPQPWWSTQLAAYNYLCKENNINIERSMSVRLSREGGVPIAEFYDKDKIEKGINVFKSLIKMHKQGVNTL